MGQKSIFFSAPMEQKGGVDLSGIAILGGGVVFCPLAILGGVVFCPLGGWFSVP